MAHSEKETDNCFKTWISVIWKISLVKNNWRAMQITRILIARPSMV